jgi:hypothetical protein
MILTRILVITLYSMENLPTRMVNNYQGKSLESVSYLFLGRTIAGSG